MSAIQLKQNETLIFEGPAFYVRPNRALRQGIAYVTSQRFGHKQAAWGLGIFRWNKSSDVSFQIPLRKIVAINRRVGVDDADRAIISVSILYDEDIAEVGIDVDNFDTWLDALETALTYQDRTIFEAGINRWEVDAYTRLT